MASSPKWKIYNSLGEYIAACKEIEAAAALVALYGNGATIRPYHKQPLWVEGKDGCAGDSYDLVRDTIYARLQTRSSDPQAR